MKFTSSWDDGYALDLKVAELLDTHGCKGTFYVCPRKQHEYTMMNTQEITMLGKNHEIGAHTLRHSKLTKISLPTTADNLAAQCAAMDEIADQIDAVLN